MKRLLKFVGILAGLGILAVTAIGALTPWMDRWGATAAEVNAAFPGDELVPEPAGFVNRAVTIHARPEDIYPWIVQLDAKKGGWYSYTWLETYLLNCPMVNADRIHEEWQNLKVGDEVHMCPNEPGPPPYIVAQIHPNQAIVLGHKENGEWVDLYQFIIIAQTDGSSRLIVRTRTMAVGGFWTIIHPGIFVMERGMLLGIKERAEYLAETRSVRPVPEVTPTPEVFIPLEEAIPEPVIMLEGVHLEILNATLDQAFPADCVGEAPACIQAQNGKDFLSVVFKPRDLPEGQMLAYKNLPAVSVVMEGSLSAPYSVHKYDNATHTLTLGFEVPEKSTVFGLKWADLREIPLEVTISSSPLQTVSLFEFGQKISLSYDPALAQQVKTGTVPAVPPSDQILFAEAHPAYAQIRFEGFQNGRPYDLPLLPWDDRVARVMVFQTADFPGFGDDSPQGFVSQQQALSKLIETGIDSNRCAKPLMGYEQALPFLPWINMQQSFCAQPQMIEFSGGKGIRYLSYYSQGPNPVLDQQVFYTFQGLTKHGKFYISALFPIQTGIFPTNPPDCSKCGQSNYDPMAEWNIVLTEQLNQLNSRANDDFEPSLTVLDELIQSIQIGQ